MPNGGRDGDQPRWHVPDREQLHNARPQTLRRRFARVLALHSLPQLSWRGFSDGINNDFEETQPHNHLPISMSPEVRTVVALRLLSASYAFRSVKGKAVLKEEAVNSRATLSGTLASDAHEGLSDEAIQGFPSQRNLQQVVNRIRKIPNAAQADKPPSELVIVSTKRLSTANEELTV